MRQITASDPYAAIAFEARPGEWIIHHPNHRDDHEPDAIDCQDGKSGGHPHSDHVLQLDCPQHADVLTAKTFKLAKLALAVPVFPRGDVASHAAQAPVQLNAAQPPPSRNTSLHFVQLAQLRI